jgi:hypothetical protein
MDEMFRTLDNIGQIPDVSDGRSNNGDILGVVERHVDV